MRDICRPELVQRIVLQPTLNDYLVSRKLTRIATKQPAAIPPVLFITSSYSAMVGVSSLFLPTPSHAPRDYARRRGAGRDEAAGRKPASSDGQHHAIVQHQRSLYTGWPCFLSLGTIQFMSCQSALSPPPELVLVLPRTTVVHPHANAYTDSPNTTVTINTHPSDLHDVRSPSRRASHLNVSSLHRPRAILFSPNSFVSSTAGSWQVRPRTNSREPLSCFRTRSEAAPLCCA